VREGGTGTMVMFVFFFFLLFLFSVKVLGKMPMGRGTSQIAFPFKMKSTLPDHYTR
jgi:hypothetical protein